MTSSTTKNDDATARRYDGAEGARPEVGSTAAQLQVSTAPLSLREGERAALRPAVAVVEGALARLGSQQDLDGYARAAEQLTVSWQSLVSLMALGTAPELRSCPHCGYRILVKATRCVQCWKMSDAA
jgi:hypothetical protein